MTTRKVIALLVVALFIATGLTVLASGTGEQSHRSAFPTATATAYSPIGAEPNPVMNTNITWSTFYNGWSPLEYNTSTRNNTLNTQLNPNYANPITVNPADIQTTQLTGNIGQIAWKNPANWTLYGGSLHGIHAGTSGSIYVNGSSLNTGTNNQARNFLNLSISDLPSANTKFDFVNILANLATPLGMVTGDGWYIGAQNLTNINGMSQEGEHIANGTATAGSYERNNPGATFISMPLNAFVANLPNGYVDINIGVDEPNTVTNATNTETLTIYGMSITTTPLSLGTISNATGTHPINALFQETPITSFNPSFAWTSITNGGYTVATSQPLQNLSTGQTSINDGSYVEQVTYQGYEQLPTAPDLSYAVTNITMPINVPGNQFVVANVNGVSYLSGISGKDNGTYNFGTMNPNNQNNIVLEIKYTAAQWNGISAPPVWYSVAGIEYYWYVFLGVLLGLIGLGAGMKSRASTFRQVKK